MQLSYVTAWQPWGACGRGAWTVFQHGSAEGELLAWHSDNELCPKYYERLCPLSAIQLTVCSNAISVDCVLPDDSLAGISCPGHTQPGLLHHDGGFLCQEGHGGAQTL